VVRPKVPGRSCFSMVHLRVPAQCVFLGGSSHDATAIAVSSGLMAPVVCVDPS
jgi:hypothetical protein